MICFIAKDSRSRGAGFSFIELLMVLAIISLLVALALPSYRDYTLRAEVSESLTLLGDYKSQVNDFYARWGDMPTENSNAGLKDADQLRGQYVRSVTVSGGVLIATMRIGRDQTGEAFERTLTIRPWINSASTASPIIWSCGEHDPRLPADYHVIGTIAAGAVEAKWLPSICRN